MAEKYTEMMDAWIAAGKELGLDGDPLIKFVKEAQEAMEKLERDLRAEKRQDEAEKRQVEAEKRQAEKEAMELEHKERMLDKEIELAKIKGEHGNNGNGHNVSKARAPKLPSYSEKDDLDAYLERFERFATCQKWAKEDWAVNLSALLTGKALEVYSRLSVADAEDFDKLKAALLKRYQLTEEGFRHKFRESKADSGESPGQYVVRLENYLTRWMKMGKVPETYDGLRGMIVREQFLSTCNPDLAVYLRERESFKL